MPAEEIDIAVVGAGMAGLYAAWRLLDAGADPQTIRLFEAGARVGGRVLTVHAPDEPAMALDLGAHNFHTDHALVGALVRRFGLDTAPCAGQTPAGLLYLRGQTRTNAELARSYLRKPFPYGVSAYLQRRGPARILREALRRMPADSSGMGSGRSLGGRPLGEWPLQAALLQVLGSEDIRYVADRIGYSFWHTPVHAEAVLEWAARELFHGSRPMSELRGGMSELPRALAAAIRAFGATVELRHRLAAVELPASASEAAMLRFEAASGKRRSVRARRVILALPRGALERVDGLAAHPPVNSLLQAVTDQRAVTTALLYPDAWWRSIGLEVGVSVTDLPARHIRHYGAEAWRNGAAVPGALLSYSDGGNADFWRSLAGDAGASGWIDADHPLAAELHRQACLIFEGRLGRKLPMPLKAVTQDWQDSSGGAAFHLWSAGSDPKKAMAAALKPFPDRALHICGEAWSLRQGWIEGALETVDAMLERSFEIAPASGQAT